MGFLSKFEGKMEDTVEGVASSFGGSSLSPVQITKKAEKQMRREKMVGAGIQYAPTLYTVLVSPEDDARMFGYYPTLAGEVETYLIAKANENGLMMDGQPLVRFLADSELKRGKFDVVAEMVASPIIAQLREEEMARYGIDAPMRGAGPKRQVKPAVRGAVAGVPAALANTYSAGQPQNLQPLRPGHGAKSPVRKVQPLQQQQAPAAYQPQGQSAYQPQPQPQPYQPQGVDALFGGQSAYVSMNVAADAAAGAAAVGAAGGEAARSFYPKGDPYYAPQQQAQPAMQAHMQAQPAAATQVANPVADPGADRNDSADFPVSELGAYLYDEEHDRAWALDGTTQSIGRESGNDVQVSDINASRRHASIGLDTRGRWVITDLGSTNGVYVNGRQVESVPLYDADIILIGTTELEFQLLQ